MAYYRSRRIPKGIYTITPQKRIYQTHLQLTRTPEEILLWNRLKSRQLGVTFVTQKIILGYIVDFYCQKYKLVVEVDGDQHYTPENIEKDRKRTLHLNEVGIFVLRFSNDEISRKMEECITKIKEILEYREKSKQEFIRSKSKIKEIIEKRKSAARLYNHSFSWPKA